MATFRWLIFRASSIRYLSLSIRVLTCTLHGELCLRSPQHVSHVSLTTWRWWRAHVFVGKYLGHPSKTTNCCRDAWEKIKWGNASVLDMSVYWMFIICIIVWRFKLLFLFSPMYSWIQGRSYNSKPVNFMIMQFAQNAHLVMARTVFCFIGKPRFFFQLLPAGSSCALSARKRRPSAKP